MGEGRKQRIWGGEEEKGFEIGGKKGRNGKKIVLNRSPGGYVSKRKVCRQDCRQVNIFFKATTEKCSKKYHLRGGKKRRDERSIIRESGKNCSPCFNGRK